MIMYTAESAERQASRDAHCNGADVRLPPLYYTVKGPLPQPFPIQCIGKAVEVDLSLSRNKQ